jgi:hypothetical protein
MAAHQKSEATAVREPAIIEKGVTTFCPRGPCHRPAMRGTTVVVVIRFASRNSCSTLYPCTYRNGASATAPLDSLVRCFQATV